MFLVYRIDMALLRQVVTRAKEVWDHDHPELLPRAEIGPGGSFLNEGEIRFRYMLAPALSPLLGWRHSVCMRDRKGSVPLLLYAVLLPVMACSLCHI